MQHFSWPFASPPLTQLQRAQTMLRVYELWDKYEPDVDVPEFEKLRGNQILRFMDRHKTEITEEEEKLLSHFLTNTTALSNIDAPQDYDYSICQRLLNLDRSDLWLKPGDNDWHLPLLVTITPKSRKNIRKRSVEGQAKHKQKKAESKKKRETQKIWEPKKKTSGPATRVRTDAWDESAWDEPTSYSGGRSSTWQAPSSGWKSATAWAATASTWKGGRGQGPQDHLVWNYDFYILMILAIFGILFVIQNCYYLYRWINRRTRRPIVQEPVIVPLIVNPEPPPTQIPTELAPPVTLTDTVRGDPLASSSSHPVIQRTIFGVPNTAPSQLLYYVPSVLRKSEDDRVYHVSHACTYLKNAKHIRPIHPCPFFPCNRHPITEPFWEKQGGRSTTRVIRDLTDPFFPGSPLMVFIMDIEDKKNDCSNATYHLCVTYKECPESAFQSTYLRGQLYRFRMCMGCYLAH